MAPHAVTNQDSHGKQRTITVLCTGFGPFQDRYPVNPSYEITRALTNTLNIRTADGIEAQIIGYGAPIRVSYEEVRDLVPVLHETYFGSADIVLHLGMASGRHFYTAELYAHRDGYSKSKDLDGKTLPEDDGLVHFGDCPSMMTTSLDYGEILSKWKANLRRLPEDSPGRSADCRPSEDAGHYLCDYIYYNSLAWHGRLHGRLDGGKASDRPIMFLHVPAEIDLVTLEKGRQVTLALIEAMVDSYCSSQQNDDVLETSRLVARADLPG